MFGSTSQALWCKVAATLLGACLGQFKQITSNSGSAEVVS